MREGLKCISYRHAGSKQMCVVPWGRVRSACTFRSPCRWRSPGAAAGSTFPRWSPCSRCRSRSAPQGCPWSCSCNSGIPTSWACGLKRKGKYSHVFSRVQTKDEWLKRSRHCLGAVPSLPTEKQWEKMDSLDWPRRLLLSPGISYLNFIC